MNLLKAVLCSILTLSLLTCAGGCAASPAAPSVKTFSVSAHQVGVFDQALQDLLAQAGSDAAEILLPVGNFELKQSHAVGANVTLTFARGASLTLAKEATLTVHGTVKAPATYIFRGEGTVAGDIQGTAYVQWFGADEAKNDHTACFQKALDCCRHIVVPHRANPYKITQLRAEKPVTLTGSGANRVMLDVLNENGNTFTVASDNVHLENLQFKLGRTAPGDTVTVYLDTAQRNLNDISLYNVHISNPCHAVADAKSDRYVVTNLTLDHMKIGGNRNTGIHLTDCTTGILLNDVTVSSFSPNFITKGFVFENVEQMHLENVDNLGGLPKPGDGGDGLTFINCKNVTGYRIMTDYLNGRHLVIQDCSNFRISNFVTSLLRDDGVYIDGLTDSQLDVFKANDGATHNSQSPAVHLKRCHNNTFNDLIIILSVNEGLILEDCSNNVFNNLVTSGASLPYALNETASCSNNVFNGVSLKGDYSLQGSGSTIHSLASKHGTLFELISAPAQG